MQTFRLLVLLSLLDLREAHRPKGALGKSRIAVALSPRSGVSPLNDKYPTNVKDAIAHAQDSMLQKSSHKKINVRKSCDKTFWKEVPGDILGDALVEQRVDVSKKCMEACCNNVKCTATKFSATAKGDNCLLFTEENAFNVKGKPSSNFSVSLFAEGGSSSLLQEEPSMEAQTASLATVSSGQEGPGTVLVGCACKDTWEFMDKTYKACPATMNDDNTGKSSWCYVEKTPCEGMVQDSEISGVSTKWMRCISPDSVGGSDECTDAVDSFQPGWQPNASLEVKSKSENCYEWSQDSRWGALKDYPTLELACAPNSWGRLQCTKTCCDLTQKVAIAKPAANDNKNDDEVGPGVTGELQTLKPKIQDARAAIAAEEAGAAAAAEKDAANATGGDKMMEQGDKDDGAAGAASAA